MWLLFVGNAIPLLAQHQYTLYHQSRYRTFAAKLEEIRQADYHTAKEAAERQAWKAEMLAQKIQARREA